MNIIQIFIIFVFLYIHNFYKGGPSQTDHKGLKPIIQTKGSYFDEANI